MTIFAIEHNILRNKFDHFPLLYSYHIHAKIAKNNPHTFSWTHKLILSFPIHRFSSTLALESNQREFATWDFSASSWHCQRQEQYAAPEHYGTYKIKGMPLTESAPLYLQNKIYMSSLSYYTHATRHSIRFNVEHLRTFEYIFPLTFFFFIGCYFDEYRPVKGR